SERMQKRTRRIKFSLGVGGGCGVWASMQPTAAHAHVKWFAPYDVAQAPIGLTGVFNPTFVELLILTLSLFWILCAVERTPIGAPLSASVDEVFVAVRDKIDTLIRAITGAFFIS